VEVCLSNLPSNNIHALIAVGLELQSGGPSGRAGGAHNKMKTQPCRGPTVEDILHENVSLSVECPDRLWLCLNISRRGAASKEREETKKSLAEK
jgi:hypothetical protein